MAHVTDRRIGPPKLVCGGVATNFPPAERALRPIGVVRYACNVAVLTYMDRGFNAALETEGWTSASLVYVLFSGL